MNLKVLFLFLVYYGVLSSVFLLGGQYLGDATSNIDLTADTLTESDLDTGGIFSSGISFTRFLIFLGFGVGLPSDTPAWANTLFILWQSMVFILFIGFLLSSIWDG